MLPQKETSWVHSPRMQSSPSGLLHFFLGSEGDLYTPSSHRIPRCTASKLTDFSPLKIACPQKSKDRRTKSHPLFNQVRFFQETPDLFPEYIFWETIRPQMVLLWTRILVSETPVFLFAAWIFFGPNPRQNPGY